MITVVIVTYNSEHTIEKCIASALARKADAPVEIIIVDNASQDKTRAIVKEKFPGTTLIANKKNKGFASACNQAIKEAKGEFILLLNPDAVLQENCMNILYDFMGKNPKCAAAGPSLWNSNGTFQSSAYNFPGFSWVLFHLLRLSEWLPGKSPLRGMIEPSSKAAQQSPSSVHWVTGACMLLRHEALNDAGMFDENFFLFFEEIDWCKRAHEKGWQLFYVPKARAAHEIGGSSKSARTLSISSRYKSMSYYFKKHYGMPGYLYVRVLLFLFFSFHIFFLKLFHSRQPCAREKINAYTQVLFS